MSTAVEKFGFRYGIEEEFFLVHARTGRLTLRMPGSLVREARDRLGSAIGPELMQSQLEISSPILADSGQARECLSGLRQGLAQVVEQYGLRLLSAGTHPLGAWRGQAETSRRHYRRLVDDFQIVARRNLVCGLHVHAEVPPGVDRVHLMNRVMPWLPLFLALSTSSPFWNRERTGLLSYRQAIYDEWPRTGIPDFFEDQAQYDRFADLLAANNAIKDAGSLWWAIRPSLRYPTLELRIADSCTRLRDTLAIASLFRCLVRSLVRRPGHVPARSPITRRVIDENRWRAKRFGIDAKFIDEGGGPTTTVPLALQALREDCAEDAEALDCHDDLADLDRILADGTSADRQLALYHQHREEGDNHAQALGHVVDWLLTSTAESWRSPS